MKEWIEKGEALSRYIRPLTFPLAVKVVEDVGDIPERARRPQRDLGVKVMMCQGMTMARKYGWTVAITAEDTSCPFALPAFGWQDFDAAGAESFLLAISYAKDVEAARKQVAVVKDLSLERGKYAGVVFSPLEWTRVEPDLVMVYCNPAQTMRLVHGATWEMGGHLTSVFAGRAASCTEGVIQTFLSQEPKVVLPGNGDRVWGMTQDDEMLFTIPARMLGTVIEGLEATHRRGIRYPIPVDVRHEATFPQV